MSHHSRPVRQAHPRGRLDTTKVAVAQAPKSNIWQQSFAFLLISLLVLALVAPGAMAQDEAGETKAPATLHMINAAEGLLTINQASDVAPEVSITVNGSPTDSLEVTRAVNSDVAVSTVIVIDTSVLGDPAFEGFKEIANALISAKSGGEQMAIVSTGSAVNVRASLTRSQPKLLERISQLESKGDLYLWDGIYQAAQLLEETPRGSVRKIVVLAATKDLKSFAAAGTARGEMLSTNAIGHVVGVERDGLDVGSLNRFAAESKGSIELITDPEDVATLADSLVASAQGSWIVSFDNPELPNGGEMVVTIDGQATRANFIKGSITSGPALTPVPTTEGNRFALITGSLAKTLGVALGGLAIGMGTFAIFLLFQKRESSIGSLLSPYEEDGFGSEFGEDEESGFAQNALVSRAVDFTEDFADKRGILENAAGKLERANIALRPAEAVTMYFAAVVFGAFMGLMFRGPVGFLLGAALGGFLPILFINYKGNKRRKKFTEQLPDMLQLLAGTLKAGYSFMQGIEAVSKEADAPMGDELRIVVTEAQLGKPVEEAMSAAAVRMDSPDFEWAVMAVNIQREVGGNLAELLMTVSETMTARDRLRREVMALTAEGRVSAMVLGAMPILLGMAMYAINPEYIGVLFKETVGRILIGVALVSITLGFLWMKKLIEIRI